MWLFAVVAVLVSVLNRTEGARISLPNPDAGDREGRHWLVYRQVIPDSLDLGKRAASDAYMCGTLDVCFCGPVGIAGDICPKHDKSVTFHLRLHDPEVLGVASAQQVFAHHHHLHSPESSGVEAGVVATGIVPRAVRHLASRAAGASESSQAGVHSDSGFIAVNMTLSSHIRILGEDEDVEAPLAVVLLSSQPPVRAPSEPEAAADTKTEPQRTRGAMDLAAEAHAPLAMVKVWLGEEELMSESIEKACRSNYSTLHLGQAPPESDDRAHTHHGDQEVLSEVPAVPDMCNLTILVPCELLRRQLRRAQQDMLEDARVELGTMVWSVGTPWIKSVFELPLCPSLCAPRGGATKEGKVHNSEERIEELEAPVSRLENDVKKYYEQKELHGEHHPPVAINFEVEPANSFYNIGNVYYSQGQYERALEYYQKPLDIRIRVFGSDHLDVAKSYNNIGNVYDSQGKYEEALEMHTKSLDIRTRIHGGDNHPDVATSKYNIASLKETQGDLEGARRLFLECEQIYVKVLGADHEETLDAAMRAQTVGEEKEEEEGEEGDSDQGEEKEEGQEGDSGERE